MWLNCNNNHADGSISTFHYAPLLELMIYMYIYYYSRSFEFDWSRKHWILPCKTLWKTIQSHAHTLRMKTFSYGNQNELPYYTDNLLAAFVHTEWKQIDQCLIYKSRGYKVINKQLYILPIRICGRSLLSAQFQKLMINFFQIMIIDELLSDLSAKLITLLFVTFYFLPLTKHSLKHWFKLQN